MSYDYADSEVDASVIAGVRAECEALAKVNRPQAFRCDPPCKPATPRTQHATKTVNAVNH